MIGVTADTNVYISALNFAGAPRRFLEAAESGLFRLAVSGAILAELRGVLREKFNWSDAATEEALLLLSGCATLVNPTQTFDVVPNDPDDNRVIECAVAAGSPFIVTGDSDPLEIGRFGTIQILRIAEFLKLIAGPPS